MENFPNVANKKRVRKIELTAYCYAIPYEKRLNTQKNSHSIYILLIRGVISQTKMLLLTQRT